MIKIYTLKKYIVSLVLTTLVLSVFITVLPLVASEQKHVKPKFTESELQYISQSKPFSMAYASEWSPFEFHDNKSIGPKGFNKDVVDLISDRSGLKFDFVNSGSYEECIEIISNKKVDLLMSCNMTDDDAKTHNIILSKPFVTMPIALVGTSLNITYIPEGKAFALPHSYTTIINYVNQTFPNNTLILKNTVDECYDALISGEADFTLENMKVAEEVISSNKYSGLHIVYATSLMESMSIATHIDTNPTLMSVINKTIATLTYPELENIAYKNIGNKPYPLKFREFWIANHTVMIIAFVMLLIAGLIISVFVNSIKSKGRDALWEVAYIDTLTGIGNLNKFKIGIENLLSKNEKKLFALIKLDIEKFKLINDMFGFEEGNRALCNVAKAIEACVNTDDNEIGLCCRIASDDFVLLVKYKNDDDIVKKCESIYAKFFVLQIFPNTMYRVDFNVGIYKLKPDDVEFNSIFDRVTMAHKNSKNLPNGSIEFYNDAIRDEAIRVKEIENTMVQALENGEFIVYIQPKYYTDTLKMCGAEALIRWKNPVIGVIPPDKFIPIFEKNGFVVNIDNFILEEVCKYQRMLIDKGKIPLPISVNQSKLHLKNPNYVDNVKNIVLKYDIPPSLIELELTETTMHDNIVALCDIIKELKQFGFDISIDDFGSGYSSLNLLKDIPVTIIKIDREFLKSSEHNKRGKIVLANIIRLAKELDMQIVTEGVETKAQEAMLLELGSHMVQGYLYARPAPLEQFEALLCQEV